MSFSGIKYRRMRCENINEMIRAENFSPQSIHMLTAHPPTFSFIRLDEQHFIFKLILQDRVMSQKFCLGQEFEMEKHNGTKLKVTYTLEGDDVLNQVIKHPDGRVTLFRREFGTSNKMIVTTSGKSKPLIIYYERVD